MSERDNQASLAASDAVFAWCLRSALRMEREGDIERAALWAYVAAGTGIYYGHSHLCSPPLETLVARLGTTIAPASPGTIASDSGGSRGRRWLHVFSETLIFGGHTVLARRWIGHDRSGDRHALALTMQSADKVESGLARAVTATGGSVKSVAGEGGLVRRAARLRQLAIESADVVVLHAHQWDVVPSMAFAAAGGPPVLLLNHADHAFWVGVSVADTVIDIRDSGLALSRRFRGVRRSAMLPVPLEDRGLAPPDRTTAAARLDDPTLLDAGLVLLTVGSGYKYRKLAGLDFPETLARIVEMLPECVAIAVGPEANDPLWQALKAQTRGRVRAVGLDADLAAWHAAADLYLEGFPVGSYTALLEVALAGRAFVRKPLLAPPEELPIDRGGLAGIEPPATPDAYVLQAMQYAHDPQVRSRDARATRSAVLATHCGEGWMARLEDLRGSLPSAHEPSTVGDLPSLTPGLRDYWARFHAAPRYEGPLEFAIRTAEAQGLRVRTDIAVRDASLSRVAKASQTDRSL
jgi:hypothetical protein